MHISGHVSDEVLLAFLDREIQAEEQSEIEGHVERCQACAVRLAGLRAATGHVGEALEALDVDPPWTDMPAELAEAARDTGATGIRAITTAPSVRRSRRFSGRAMAVAASLVFLLAAGAWAVPGSPLRAWLSRSVASVSDLLRSDSPETEVAGATAGAEETAASGVSVQPLNGLVRISVRTAGPGARVRVGLTDAEFASARSTEAGGGYSVGPGYIEIVQPSGEMMIEIPRRVPDARVEIDGRVVVRKRGDELYLTPAADSSTAEILLETEG